MSFDDFFGDCEVFTDQVNGFRAATKTEGFLPTYVLISNAMRISEPKTPTMPRVQSWDQWLSVMNQAFINANHDTETRMMDKDPAMARETQVSLGRLKYKFDCLAGFYQQMDPRTKATLNAIDIEGGRRPHLANGYLLSIEPLIFSGDYKIK